MNTAKFATTYLTETANVCIHFDNGDIIYFGEIGNAPYRLLRHTQFKSLDGLSENGEIFLCVLATPAYHNWNKNYRID